MTDNTIQPNDLKHATQRQLTDGLNRVTDHIDAKFEAFQDEATTRADALDLRVRDLEAKRHQSQEMHTELNSRLDVVLAKLEHLNDLHRRFNDLTNRVNAINDDLDNDVRAQIFDIDKRSALTTKAVDGVRSSMIEMRNEMRGVNAQMSAQATSHKSSIDTLIKSIAPQIEWIEQRRNFETRLINFVSSKLGMVLLTACATILLGNNGVQLIDFIYEVLGG